MRVLDLPGSLLADRCARSNLPPEPDARKLVANRCELRNFISSTLNGTSTGRSSNTCSPGLWNLQITALIGTGNRIHELYAHILPLTTYHNNL